MAVLTIFIHEDSPGAGSLTWLPPSQGTLGQALGLCFPPSTPDRLQQADESQEPQAGSPHLYPAQVSCQARVPGWVPVLSSPGFVLVSSCHGDQSQLPWQKRAPPGQGSASHHQPLHGPTSSTRSATGWVRGREHWGSGRSEQGLSSPEPLSNAAQGPCQLLQLGPAPGAERCLLHPWLGFHFTDGGVGTQSRHRHQEAELGREDPRPPADELPLSPELAAVTGLRVATGGLPGRWGPREEPRA